MFSTREAFGRRSNSRRKASGYTYIVDPFYSLVTFTASFAPLRDARFFLASIEYPYASQVRIYREFQLWLVQSNASRTVFFILPKILYLALVDRLAFALLRTCTTYMYIHVGTNTYNSRTRTSISSLPVRPLISAEAPARGRLLKRDLLGRCTTICQSIRVPRLIK